MGSRDEIFVQYTTSEESPVDHAVCLQKIQYLFNGQPFYADDYLAQVGNQSRALFFNNGSWRFTIFSGQPAANASTIDGSYTLVTDPAVITAIQVTKGCPNYVPTGELPLGLKNVNEKLN